MCAQHLSDVLRVRQVQGGVHLVQDVDGRRFEQQHGQDQRQGNQRPLASAQLREVLLPGVSQGHLELQAVQDPASLGGGQTGVGPRQQGGEDGAKVLVHLEEEDSNEQWWSPINPRAGLRLTMDRSDGRDR